TKSDAAQGNANAGCRCRARMIVGIRIGTPVARSPIRFSVAHEPEIGWRRCMTEIKRSCGYNVGPTTKVALIVYAGYARSSSSVSRTVLELSLSFDTRILSSLRLGGKAAIGHEGSQCQQHHAVQSAMGTCDLRFE